MATWGHMMPLEGPLGALSVWTVAESDRTVAASSLSLQAAPLFRQV